MRFNPGSWLNEILRKFYFWLGCHIGTRPWPFIIVPVVLIVLSAVGAFRFHEEDRVWYLYSPTTAASHYEHAVANSYFDDKGGKFWVEVPVTAKDGGSLLRENYLEAVQNLSRYVASNVTVKCPANATQQCSFSQLCHGDCNSNQVLSILGMLYRNASYFHNHPNFRLTYPTMQLYNDQYYVGEHFSGVHVDVKTNRIDSIKLIVLHYRTDILNSSHANALHEWELQVLDLARSFHHPDINMSASSDGMISYEVRRNGLTCMPYFGLSIVVVLIYVVVSSIRRDAVLSKPWEAVMGVTGPLLAIVASYSLLISVAFPFNSIVIVMPFLVLGIGVDDFFIIMHAWRKCSHINGVSERLGETMRDAGPSITITSLTNGFSFGIGAFSSTPAIRLFCLYTATGIIVDFLIQVTFFCAFMALGGRREVQGQNGNSGLLCASRWRRRQLILEDSPLHGVAWTYHEYLWRQGSLFYVFVDKPPDFTDPRALRNVLEMAKKFENLPYSMGRNSTSFWLRKYIDYLHYDNAQKHFYERLPGWLNNEQYGWRWKDFVRLGKPAPTSVTLDGSLAATAVGYSKQNPVIIERFLFATGFAMGNEVSWSTRTRLQGSWRRLAASYPQFNVTVFQTYSFYVDQLESIGPTTASTVLVALLVMALVCLALIPNPVSVVSASLAMLSVNVGVFGLLALWKVNLDPITMCTILMSIGFSVDFTAHISYHYYKESADCGVPAHERMAKALDSIGRPMVQAGISTLLGIAPLFLVPSYMVTVFLKTVFLVVVLGLLHGIIILPSLLTVSLCHCCNRGCSAKRKTSIDDGVHDKELKGTDQRSNNSSSGYSSERTTPKTAVKNKENKCRQRRKQPLDRVLSLHLDAEEPVNAKESCTESNMYRLRRNST